MEKSNEIPNLICINYPGVVQNMDKVIETLGGPHALSEVLGDPNRRLQVLFRPADKLCKPVTGSRSTSSNFLIKVRVKKKTQKVVSWEVAGKIKDDHTFTSLCDFQFLAMEKGENVYNSVVPDEFNADWLKQNGPLILTPALFSRSDTLQNYYFAKEKAPHKVSESDQPARVVINVRRKRLGYAIFLNFEDSTLPTFANEKLLTMTLLQKAEVINRVKQVFEERPVCSKTAMASLSGYPEKILKDVAPYVAYHFCNGPWRAMWVRLGYDPRKDPSARVYQTLDFRVQRTEIQRSAIDDTRSSNRPVVPRTSKRSLEDDPGYGKPTEDHILLPGKLPRSRQFFYQFCDVHLPEITALLASVEVRTECHPTDGWLPEGTASACRRIIKQYIADTVDQKKGLADLEDYADYSGSADSAESDMD